MDRFLKGFIPLALLVTVALVDGWLRPYLLDRWRRRARKHDRPGPTR